MICGVVSPLEGQDHGTLVKAVARSDIVILDWWLNRKNDLNALSLLKQILIEDSSHRLRLLAFYTGDSDHEKIRRDIEKCLYRLNGSDPSNVDRNETGSVIDFGACRIVVYGKPRSGVVEPGIEISENRLADRLIDDFTDMVTGLLPSLVLTALGAVRDNIYQLLECFGPDLDPAFLVHRACLPQPQESEQHIVEQIASELYGIMENEVGRISPAGIGAIEDWLRERSLGNGIVLAPKKAGASGKPMSYDEVLSMLKHGIESEPGPLKKSGSEYFLLSHGFSNGADNSFELDRRFAAAMTLRQVPPTTERQLEMGTVIQGCDDESAILLCVMPRCDSVRLTDRTTFLFLPLRGSRSNTSQLVVPLKDNRYRRMTVCLDPSQWCSVKFEPDADRQCVLAHRNSTGQPFMFVDTDGRKYLWLGDLKAEIGQSIAQKIAGRMSRIPLNTSEWLRRSERIGDRRR